MACYLFYIVRENPSHTLACTTQSFITTLFPHEILSYSTAHKSFTAMLLTRKLRFLSTSGFYRVLFHSHLLYTCATPIGASTK